MSASQDAKVKNPKTGRMILIGKGVYNKLIEEGYTLYKGELLFGGYASSSKESKAKPETRSNERPENITETQVISLKGKRDTLGPSNENLPEDHVYIGRNLTMGGWKMKKSKWANPFKVTEQDKRGSVLQKYREYILADPKLMDSLDELEGKILCCWCSPEGCHGDVLIDLINERKLLSEE